LKKSLGITVEPRLTRIVRWPRAIPQYNVGHEARVERVFELTRRIPGLHLTGSAYRGVGVNDCVRASVALAAKLAPRDD
jgi:oxygen-dependent protoporphyrinogen oxidase